MTSSLEFLVGLLERDYPAHVAQEDFDGAHGPALRLWQRMGFLSREPGMNPIPTCPSCGEGMPYRFQDRHICNHCTNVVDPRHLLLWRLDLEAFLGWLAGRLGLHGGVRRIDARLWQLGTWESKWVICECFYRRAGPVTDQARNRLAAYRIVLIFYGLPCRDDKNANDERRVSLLELLTLRRSLKVRGLARLLRQGGEVHFDAHSGVVRVGDVWFGEVPVGSKEHLLLQCLSQQLDRFVPYGDIKHFVLQHTASRDSTDEATFCHRLKNRIKERGWVPKIDLLLATTHKGDGYRLRGHVEELGES